MSESVFSDVIVIGAGPAGIMAAIKAAENNNVLVLDHADAPLKKLSITGNGKCNFTNENLNTDCFYCKNSNFVYNILDQFLNKDLISFLFDIGIVSYKKDDYYYPNSNSAKDVTKALLKECERLGIIIKNEIAIRSIKKNKESFVIESKTGQFEARKVIMATGGASYKSTGSDGSGFLYLESLGHKRPYIVPGLINLNATDSFLDDLAGIRSKVALILEINGKEKGVSKGELQITKNGLSGICIFDVSAPAVDALEEKKAVKVILDCLPEMSNEQLLNLVLNRKDSNRYTKGRLEDLFFGMLNQKLMCSIIQKAGYNTDESIDKISVTDIKMICKSIKSVSIDIKGYGKFDSAQVSHGGVDIDEINDKTLESRITPGLFFAGEMIDVDGKCGGYNLQWAFSSGFVAGKNV